MDYDQFSSESAGKEKKQQQQPNKNYFKVYQFRNNFPAKYLRGFKTYVKYMYFN